MNKFHLVIGAGRTSQHLRHYFNLLNIENFNWIRSESLAELEKRVSKSQVIWVCISDSEIQKFVDSHKELLVGKTVFHCSGSLVVEGAIGVHPLMTFPKDQLYELSFYNQIPLIVDQKIVLKEIDERLPNPIHFVEQKNKALYHALLVVGGNFPQILANNVEKELSKMGIQSAWFRNYFLQSAKNYLAQGELSLTGPLIRNDKITIEANQRSLAGNKLSEVYTALKGLIS